MKLSQALLIAPVLLCTRVIAASAPHLVSGAELPSLGGTTLSGEPLVLPRDSPGHPSVLVVGFSKASAKIARPWLDGCRALAAKSSGPAVNCYGIRMLEEVPKFFRGTTERAMRSGLPVEIQRQTLLVYSDNDAWRERLGVANDKTAYVVGCDKDGRVRITATGEYVEAELRRVLAGIEDKPGKE